ncbi:GntR family transcriptional regulator [Algoriphagus pacificus]|uniref:GntR family transcriptional regulator n=1 Tax=Algoriphagus pacificus TaxID=2811234 RepID=A0ABS3CN80_9BACT|nr:GntR family transcriptional regulator [Algoriphagus pacificus]MBN7817705.1 GntR family transcriptional regulator [Algoriphagus pacificus]
MLVDKSERIHTDSRTPKYLQVVNLILDEIEKGKLNIGDRIPSINETSFDFLLSRDTVEKAYNELKDRGIITSVRGKGFYVSSTNVENKIKVLLLFNKLSSYKKIIYYSIIETLGDNATVDMQVHHYNADLCEDLISQSIGKYNYYVVAPHFFDKETHPVSGYELLKKIPKDKILIIDRAVKGHENEFPGIFQDFAKDIFAALESGLDHLRKYKRMILVFPKGDMYPLEIIDGFKRFCFFHDFENMILDGIDDEPLYDGDLFLVMAESDLVNIIKKSREQLLVLGQDIGLISYNETPLKEILDKGISTISTDFIHMGKSIANQILGSEDKIPIKNPFRLIVRKSL